MAVNMVVITKSTNRLAATLAVVEGSTLTPDSVIYTFHGSIMVMG